MTSPARWTLPLRTTAALVVALLLLVAVGVASWRQLAALERSHARVRRTLETLTVIQTVGRSVVAAESAQRGFLLTGDRQYLDPLEQSSRELPELLDRLRRLVPGGATHAVHLAPLDAAIRGKRDEVRRTLDVHAREGVAASVALVRTDAGRRLMDDVRTHLRALADAEEEMLRTRLAVADARNDRVTAFLIAASLLSFLLVGGGALALNGADRRRLATQARLRESEERLRVTLRSIGDAVIATDPEGRVVFMNPVAELLTGWSMPEALGRPLAEVFVIVNEGTRTTVETPVARVLREGITVGLANHTILFARDGREIPIDDSAAPIRDAGRTIMGVVLVFRDVTERRRLETEHAHATRLAAERAESARGAEALRDSEERYRSLVAASSDIVWAAGPERTFDEPQPAWEAYTGQRWPQDAGLGWAAAVHPDDRATVLTLWEAAQVTRSVLEVDGRVWHAASGEYRHCHGRGVPLLAADGSIRQWVGLIVDVHARRQAEAERDTLLRVTEEARRAAEAASKAKDDFLSIVSHELRSPLQTMLTWVELLKKGRHDAHLVTALTESVRAQETVINDLLDVSRIVSGKLTVAREPFDLAAAAATCVDRLAPSAEAKGLTLERRGFDAPRPVVGDADRFCQALHAVLHNAIKFTPSGGRIDVEARAVPGGHEVVVGDTGDGIAPELLARVFERFWQADGGKTRRHGGLGLGLAIAHHLLTAQGGTITAASAGPGRGAVFTLALAGADALPSPAAAAPARPPTSLAGLRVLLVEDDEGMSDALTALLEHRGATVTAVSSARTALGILDTVRPDVLLSDVGMPGESGYSLIREVRAREAASGRRLPALAMTGFTSAEDRDEARAAGFDDHVPKPVDPDLLVTRIRTLTEGVRDG